MTVPRVFVTRRLPEAGLEPLAGGDVRLDVRAADDPIDRATLLERAAGADALVTLLTDTVDEELLDAAGPGLRVVANYAVGTDNIDVPACTRRGVAVANTPDVLTDATADHALALLLAVARRLREGHALVSSGAWSGWQPTQLLGVQLAGATLGIVGMGRIGRAVARRAAAFGMRIRYHNRRRDAEAEAQLGARYRPLGALLAESDVVTLHCPLTPETRHLIDARRLALLSAHAILVNTARGAVVEEAALVRALAEERLFGAGLDVFEHEPALAPGLAELPNVVLAPHTGSATVTARVAMARLCADAVRSVLAGRRVAQLINPEVLAPG